MKCCCPGISDEEFLAWDLREVDWTGKTFYQVRVPMISHFPVTPELKIPKVLQEIVEQGLAPVTPHHVVFNDGFLIGSLLVEVEPPQGKHPNVQVRKKDTRMMAKVFKGPKYLVPKALKQFDRILMGKQIMATDFYFRFLTCKQCNPNDKENKTIILAKI